MRRSFYIPLLAFGVLAVLPHFAHAAGVLQAIINPGGACTCTGGSNVTGAIDYNKVAPDWGCVLQTFQIVQNDFVIFATTIITIYIAYAGFTFMLSPTNEEKRIQARNRILNAVIGLLIVLCAWLVVDSLMKVIYNGNIEGGSTSATPAQFGPWNSLLAPNGSSDCIVERDPAALPGINANANAAGSTGATPPATTPPGTTPTTPPTPPTTAPPGSACSGSSVQSAAAQGGVTMSSSEAATIACMAGPESRCGALSQNYNWDGAKSDPPSTAWGPFQITLKGNSKCLNNSACQAAAGVSGSLDCSKAFTSGGYSIPGTLLSECQKAASNLSCSAVAADCIVQADQNSPKGPYGAWAGNKDSTPAHQACIANNGG